MKLQNLLLKCQASFSLLMINGYNGRKAGWLYEKRTIRKRERERERATEEMKKKRLLILTIQVMSRFTLRSHTLIRIFMHTNQVRITRTLYTIH